MNEEIVVEQRDISDLHNKVLRLMEGKLAYYQMLAKYTKQSVKLKHHLTNIKLWEETIAETKEEYGMQ